MFDLSGLNLEDFKIKTGDVINFFFEQGMIRPPNEGRDQSLLVKVVRNCPWGRCLFCPIYKNAKFECRTAEEVKKDIGVIKALYDTCTRAFESLEVKPEDLQFNQIKIRDALRAIVFANEDIYGASFSEMKIQNLNLMALWVLSGAKSLFLQDADALVMPITDLVEVVKCFKKTFPTLERIASYSSSRAIYKLTVENLQLLANAGWSRVHIGVESAFDEVLRFMRKGATYKMHLLSGQKVKEAGIYLSVYVMPGLGGVKWSEEHALETARLMNELDPSIIRIRPLGIGRGTLLFDKKQDGSFEELPDELVVDEIGLFIENLNCTSYVASDHTLNLLGIKGQLPADKEKMLKIIKSFQGMSKIEKLIYSLKDRYNSCIRMDIGIDHDLINQVITDIQNESPGFEEKTHNIISAMRGTFI